jgi:hypothetical protein
VNPVEQEMELNQSKRIEDEIDRIIKRIIHVKSHKQLMASFLEAAPDSKVIDVSPQAEPAEAKANI